jgi:hypothetical protein
MTDKEWVGVVEGVLFSLVGVVAIALGTSWISNNSHLMQTGARTTGVVVANRRADGRGGPTYYPQVRYVVPGGQTYVVEDEDGLNPPEFRVGDSATVYYDPRHPQTALVDSAHMDSDYWMVIVLGGVAALIGAGSLVRVLLRTPTGTTKTNRRRQAPERRQTAPSRTDDGDGEGADERPVPRASTAPPARGELADLPSGAYLHDDGTPLAPLLADLRDYVVGLWPYHYFGLETLTAATAAEGQGRSATLAALADLVRRLDDVLAQGAKVVEEAPAAEGRPRAWIAEEIASFREARQALRETRTAQELLPRLGPILFNLQRPPADYVPETLDDEE